MIQVLFDKDLLKSSDAENFDTLVLSLDGLKLEDLNVVVISNLSSQRASKLLELMKEFEVNGKIFCCGTGHSVNVFEALIDAAHHHEIEQRYCFTANGELKPTTQEPLSNVKNQFFQLNKFIHSELPKETYTKGLNPTILTIGRYYNALLKLLQDHLFNSGFGLPHISSINQQHDFVSIKNLVARISRLEYESQPYQHLGSLILNLKRTLNLILNLSPSEDAYENNHKTVHKALIGHAVFNYCISQSLLETKNSTLAFVLCFRALDFYLTGISINFDIIKIVQGHKGRERMQIDGKKVSGFGEVWERIKNEYFSNASKKESDACCAIKTAINLRNSNLLYHGTQHFSLSQTANFIKATKIIITSIERRAFAGNAQKNFSENQDQLSAIFSTNLTRVLHKDLLLALRVETMT